MGRSRQVRDICDFLAATRRGGALPLSGQAGVGKTALLDAAAEAVSAAGTRVVRAAGVEFEADVSYSGLNQLLFPLTEFLGELDHAQRGALRTALGFDSGPAPAPTADRAPRSPQLLLEFGTHLVAPRRAPLSDRRVPRGNRFPAGEDAPWPPRDLRAQRRCRAAKSAWARIAVGHGNGDLRFRLRDEPRIQPWEAVPGRRCPPGGRHSSRPNLAMALMVGFSCPKAFRRRPGAIAKTSFSAGFEWALNKNKALRERWRRCRMRTAHR
ncbi:ATP-binding protein [Streptomyces sp. NBC_01190]|uniref:ATP-binding protein n=1 Tax=Streptomyces sp. NBC_01190 TaxID=2903767 RepID=UPI003868952E|nr:ATP-binding protein [Streptomyces sp. NBC_01190]